MQARNVLITGATSGIGEATAKRLAADWKRAGQRGKLLLTGRRKERLQELAKLLADSAEVHIYAFDIRSRKAVEDFAAANASHLASLDVLINNAGLAAGLDGFGSANLDDWDQMIDTNVKGLLYITRAVVPHMEARQGGHIVNIGSVAGHTTYPKGNVYCATKHAVRALNDSLRIDTIGKNIRVTSIDPGMVETEFSLVRFKGDEEKADTVYKGLKPLLPEDVADAIAWSLSRPAHVNIQEILIMPTAQASVRDVHREGN